MTLEPGLSIFKWIKVIGEIVNLSRYIHRTGVKLVHGNDLRINMSWLIATKFARCKHVWHQRSEFSQNKLVCRFISQSDKVLAISNSMKSKVLCPQLRDSIKVIFNPFELVNDSLDFDVRTRLDLNEGEKIVGFFANFEASKRPLFFIDIARKLEQRTEQALCFVMCGDFRGQRDNLQQHVDNIGLKSRIVFQGFVNNSDTYMKAFDLIINTSIREAFGRTVVEAMLNETLTLLTDIPAHREIMGDTFPELLIKRDDIDGFVEKAITLLSSDTKSSILAREMKNYAVSKYELESSLLSLEETYRLLLLGGVKTDQPDS